MKASCNTGVYQLGACIDCNNADGGKQQRIVGERGEKLRRKDDVKAGIH